MVRNCHPWKGISLSVLTPIFANSAPNASTSQKDDKKKKKKKENQQKHTKNENPPKTLKKKDQPPRQTLDAFLSQTLAPLRSAYLNFMGPKLREPKRVGGSTWGVKKRAPKVHVFGDFDQKYVSLGLVLIVLSGLLGLTDSFLGG